MHLTLGTLLFAPVLVNGAGALRGLQAAQQPDGLQRFMGGLIKDVMDPNSGAAPSRPMHCNDPLSTTCDRNGNSRNNYGYQYDEEKVKNQREEFAQAMQANFGGAAPSQAGPPPPFAQQPGAFPAGSPFGAPPSPPWAQQQQSDGEAKPLTIRQQWQKNMGMEVTEDPYGIPAPQTPQSPQAPWAAAPGPVVGGPFASAPMPPSFAGGVFPPPPFAANTEASAEHEQEAPNRGEAATGGSLTPEQRERAAAIVAAAQREAQLRARASAASSGSHSSQSSQQPYLLPPAQTNDYN